MNTTYRSHMMEVAVGRGGARSSRRAGAAANGVFSLIVAAVVFAAVPSSPLAVPPEVMNLRFEDQATMSWDFVEGTEGYHVYRSTVDRIRAGDYGDCLVGSHRSTSLGGFEDPPMGVVHTILVASFDEDAQGTLGFTSAGVERAYPPNPCKPARRLFDFQANGDPGDGVLDGVTMYRNAFSATEKAGGEVTGVYLHSGEFFVTAADVTWLGRGAAQPGEIQEWEHKHEFRSGKWAHSDYRFSVPSGGRVNPAASGFGVEIGNPFPALVAAIAVPNLLESRKSGNESAAIGALRTVVSAQAMFREGDKDGDGLDYGVALPIVAAIAIPNLIESRKNGNESVPIPALGTAGAIRDAARGNLDLVPGFLIPTCPTIGECHEYCVKKQYDLFSDCVQRWLACYPESTVIPAPCPVRSGDRGFFEDEEGVIPPGGGAGAPQLGLSSVPGRGRTYRSQVAYNGPLGHGWDSTANARLVPSAGNVIHHDGTGRADLFLRTGPATFASPLGLYSLLIQNPDGSFTLRDPGGTLHDFHGFDGTNREGAVERVTDRNGNFSSFLYDHQGLLTTFVDTMGRSISYAYDAMGRITSITDFAGRQVQYGYDANGDLVSVRSPVVTGTPNGNDFPSGKVTKYTYSSGFADVRLNHNLTGIIRPNEDLLALPVTQEDYGFEPGEYDFDRVTRWTIGGTNASGVAAGGALSFTFAPMNPGHPPDPVTPRRKATVTDRNGNMKEFVHNHAGNLLTRTDFTNRDLRPGEPDYTTQFTYNADGEMTEAILPEGNRIQVTYDTASPNRGSQGNPVEIRAVPDNPGGAGGGSGRGDGHGGTLFDRVWTFVYEPVFNGLLSMTDPRGNDPGYVPQNAGAQSAARYTTMRTYDFQEGDPATNGIGALASRFGIDLGGISVNLGDRNGDGILSQAKGNVVRRETPSVMLDPASNQAAIAGDTSQEAVSLYEWNDLGQITSVRDPEGNRDEFEYFPENDPDGDGVAVGPPDDGRVLNPSTGGYLRTARFDTMSAPGRNNGTDPTPTMIQHDFEYDDVGNVTGFIDGNGVLTRYVVNALNQVVEARRAAATADLSGPDGDPPTGRGVVSGVDPCWLPVGFKTRYFYDANDKIQSVQMEDRGATRGVGPFVETTFMYDILDNLLQVSRETTPTMSLVTEFRYDANENLVQVTQPEGNTHAWAWDERALLLSRTDGVSGPRGGVPATRSYEYDRNGNLTRITDPRGGLVDYAYDGFDRLARTTDQVGSTADSFYDPVSGLVRALRRGPVGGPTPADRSGTTNVDLADTRFLYDERNRLFRTDRLLFVPAGAMPARTPILAEGPLVPADGAVNTALEYDRLSRLTFALRDSGATTRYDYDGAGRRIETTHPQGVEVWEMTYDDGHNLIETVEREFADTPAGGSLEERFFTTAFHDALGRPEVVVDNVGQTRLVEYDSLDAIVAASDARGPSGGTINRRSPGNETMMVPVNAHGNVTNFTYDGAGRLLTTVRILTATAEGDGTLSPPPDDTMPFNPDGLITRTTVWDGNSLPLRSVDDRGNETFYAYDNQNRLVSWTGDDGAMYLYSHDPVGNVTGITDPKGSMFTNTYDLGHRLVTTEIVPAPGVEGTTNQTFEYDGLGRLTRTTDGNQPPPDDDVTASFIYDSLSRLVEEGQQIGPVGSPVLTTGYGWMAGNLMTDLIYPDGRNIRYAYDAAGRLMSVSDLDRTRTERATYEYFGLGRVHTRTYSGGPVSTMMNDAGDMDIGFDGVGRPTLLRHRDPAGGPLFAGFEYRYDPESNPTSHRRLHHADALGNLKGETYAYDSAGRLVSFREGFLDTGHVLVGPPDDNIGWRLDGESNWAETTRNGVTYLATPNNMNEYGEPKMGGVATDDGVLDDFHDDASTADPDGLNFANDENGDLTFDGRHDLFFDAFGRLVRAVRNLGPTGDPFQVASYTYDALGRRVTRVVTNSGPLDGFTSYRYGSGPEEFSGADVQAWTLTHEIGHSLGALHEYDPGSYMGTPTLWGAKTRTIEEGTGVGAPVRQIMYGNGKPLWQIRNTGGSAPAAPSAGTSEYFLEDPFGSAIAVFTPGAGPGGGGGIVERVTYDPYGKPVFESEANVPLTDVAGNFLPQSQFGNTRLWRGMEYEPELGERTADPNTDWGGLYGSGPLGWAVGFAGSEWKYTPVGRFAMFLEASLYGGTQWSVFEPGGAPGSHDISAIHSFALNSGDPLYVASGKVPGWTLHQFSMKEYGGRGLVFRPGELWDPNKGRPIRRTRP